MASFEERIGYTFKNRALLEEALTHSSFGYENQSSYNERLEFLGDAILGYVVSRELFSHFPEKDEGLLSKLKSVLVSSRTLAKKARDIGLADMLRLGKGETKAGGHKKSSIRADALEALIGAISLDGGLQEAKDFIVRILGEDIYSATIDIKNATDFKTLLQEKLQHRAWGLPTYTLIKEEGPAHKRLFLMEISVGNYKGPMGEGSSKKNAQQDAARQLLEDETFWQTYLSEETTT